MTRSIDPARPGIGLLRTETKLGDTTLERVQPDGTFSGYASFFGEKDLGDDIVEAGAFQASLARRGAAAIRMLYQHDASAPIGVWTAIREDGRGLRVDGRIAIGTGLGREVLELMREGAIDGLSIGYRTVRARKNARTGARHILEADLWEISVVTFPMLQTARIDAIGPRPTLEQRFAAIRKVLRAGMPATLPAQAKV